MTTEYYFIQWQVPSQNAIGGESYWENVRHEGRDRWDYETAVALLEEYDKDNEYRLVKVTEEVIERWWYE